MAKAHVSERRQVQQCPYCKSTAITQETTITSTTSEKWWRCSPCGKTWPERRQSSVA